LSIATSACNKEKKSLCYSKCTQQKKELFHKRSLHNCNKKKQELALQPFFSPQEVHIAKQYNMALGNDNKEGICIKAWSLDKQEQFFFNDHGVAMGSSSINCLSNYC
jgi:hypothetical protein